MNQLEILEVAARFRSAIELGTLFRVRYAIPAEIVCGELERLSHVWINIGELIVDITADQFCDHFPGVEPVIVASDSAVHAKFRVTRRCAPLILGSDEPESEFAEDARLDYEDIVNEFERLRGFQS